MNKKAIVFMAIGWISFFSLAVSLIAYEGENLYWSIGSAIAMVSSFVTSELFLTNEDYTD